MKGACVSAYGLFRCLCYNRPQEISDCSHASFVGDSYKGSSVETQMAVIDVRSLVTHSP